MYRLAVLLAAGVLVVTPLGDTAFGTILDFHELRDAADRPWDASVIRDTGQTFTNLHVVLPEVFIPDDRLTVTSTGFGPGLRDRFGETYVSWGDASASGRAVTFEFNRPVLFELQAHDDFARWETVDVSGLGAEWTVTDNDLDIGSNGNPIPAGNITGSGSESISVRGVGSSGSSYNHGFRVWPTDAISSFTWNYGADPGHATSDHGFLVDVVPEPSSLILLTSGLGALGLIVCRRRRRCRGWYAGKRQTQDR